MSFLATDWVEVAVVVVSSTAVIFVSSWGLYVFGRLGIKLSSKFLKTFQKIFRNVSRLAVDEYITRSEKICTHEFS